MVQGFDLGRAPKAGRKHGLSISGHTVNRDLDEEVAENKST